MTIKRLLAGLVLSVSMSQPATGDVQYGIEVDQAELLFMMGHYGAAADLELGRYGNVNDTAAARHYRKAAVLGFPPAQNGLGRLYELGRGVPLDYTMAYVWYSLAAASGDDNAAANRDGVARHLTREGLLKAQTLARALRQQLP